MRLLIALTILLFPVHAHAAGEVINVKVLGMVCDFCAQSIMKVIQKNDDVEKVDIDLDNELVIIHIKPGATLSDEKIEEYIHYSGYDLESIERADNAK